MCKEAAQQSGLPHTGAYKGTHTRPPLSGQAAEECVAINRNSVIDDPCTNNIQVDPEPPFPPKNNTLKKRDGTKLTVASLKIKGRGWTPNP